MTEYTPGPWTVHLYGGFKTEVRSPKGRRIAATFVQCQPRTREGYAKQAATNETNARLIAAAPELLEALRQMVANAQLDGKTYRDCYKKARAAIAKAEGRQV